MFLITGCGRSGTSYMTKVLNNCGLNVGHEALGRDGVVSGRYCYEAEFYPGAHPAPRPHFDVILHQVRRPLKTIASVMTGRSRLWSQQFVPVELTASTLRFSCYYWLTWNLEAERQALWTYRIEDLEDVWLDLRRVLCFDTSYDLATSGVPKNTNSRQHASVTWQDVKKAAPEIYEDICLTADRYGYYDIIDINEVLT